MKKQSKKTLIRKLDKLWSAIIRERDQHKCIICGNTQTLQAHHWYIGKKAGGYSVRWNINNGICICAKCHFTAHQSGGYFLDLLSCNPMFANEKIVDDILEKKQKKFTIHDMEQKLIELQNECRKFSIDF